MAERENPSFAKNWGTLPGQVPQRSDADIKRDVESSFFRDSLVRSYEIHTEVKDGVVALSGTVDDDQARMAAEDDARRIPGVKQVQNNLQVKSQTRG